MPAAELTKIVAVPDEHMAELATTSVSRLGWRIKFVNQKLRQLSASDQKTEKIGRDNWSYAFELVVSWRKKGALAEVTVKVREREMQWTESECKDRSKAILQAINDDADEWAESESHGQKSDAYGTAR